MKYITILFMQKQNLQPLTSEGLVPVAHTCNCHEGSFPKKATDIEGSDAPVRNTWSPFRTKLKKTTKGQWNKNNKNTIVLVPKYATDIGEANALVGMVHLEPLPHETPIDEQPT
eukprot:530545-Rhodomonas_salina.3